MAWRCLPYTIDAATAFALERALAGISKTPVELRDPIANYHKMTVDELAAATPGFPVKTYLAAIGYPAPAKEIIVRQPEFFTAVGRLLQEKPLADWKVYLRWRVVSDAAPYLTAALADESFRFNGTGLNGLGRVGGAGSCRVVEPTVYAICHRSNAPLDIAVRT